MCPKFNPHQTTPEAHSSMNRVLNACSSSHGVVVIDFDITPEADRVHCPADCVCSRL